MDNFHVYYYPSQDTLFLTEYHFGISTNLLIRAFDGENWNRRTSENVYDLYYHIGVL